MEEILSEIINGESVVGSGDIAIAVSGEALSFKTINGEVITGSGNIDIEEPDVDKNYVDEELAKKQDLIDVDNKLDYSLIDNTPEIPTVPTISTDIETDATSDIKSTSPKAVKTYVDNAISAIETTIAEIEDLLEAI